MWTCEHCGETVDEDDFEVCWRCSSPRGRVETYEPVEPGADAYAHADDRKVAVFLAIQRAVRTVVAHPVVLVAAGPLLAWRLAVMSSGTLRAVFDVDPSRLEWATASTMLPDFVLSTMSHGLAILLTSAAAHGAVSVADAARAVIRRLPALLAASALYLAFAVVSWMPFVAMALLVWVLVYIDVRLGFWTVAILSDRLGVIAALRRSWELTRGNWWRMLALGLIPVIAAMPLAALPHQAGIVIALLLTPVADAITTSAYLQRIGVLPAPPRLASPLARHGAVTLPGF